MGNDLIQGFPSSIQSDDDDDGADRAYLKKEVNSFDVVTRPNVEQKRC